MGDILEDFASGHLTAEEVEATIEGMIEEERHDAFEEGYHRGKHDQRNRVPY